MNSTTITLTIYLANIQIQIIRYLLSVTLIIGNLSNITNILIFSQDSLRTHICSWYFIGSSIGHLLYLNTGCLTRVVWAWTQYDLSSISLAFCKTRIYFVLLGLTISRYLFCLISIDRWMITSRNISIRRLSSLKVIRRSIIAGTSFLIIINIFISIGYVINKNGSCGPSTEPAYFLFYTIYNVTLSLAPLFTLVIFSVLVLFNIRHTAHHQVSPTTLMTLNHEIQHLRRRFRKKDIQFIKLSLIQVAAYIVFNTLHGYNTICEVITRNQIKNAEQQAIEGFLSGMGLNLHYVYTGITFFLYTLASVTFRKECILFWKRRFERLLHLNFSRSNH
ncbi:unnamed protein product [Rotaria sp. Silwood2]|nr:unnamed protein product [Rotaria sp. Silwood2]CAF2616601.1 unnamed protein product [Rotaria sp. Silwood2]CAF2894170.1 unnamed protein product [Rotaria sp. Silwood2]CAF3010309.1 unnamed protein product [Rotaria sp. Silwood2]CAF3964220.1 unnamed protein product [Rotaria sp. Silwood2]